MQIKQTKVGTWYETKQGVGIVLNVEARRPPLVEMRIDWPFPRGRMYVSPRDILREADPPVPADA
jgi:hypothetical protein